MDGSKEGFDLSWRGRREGEGQLGTLSSRDPTPLDCADSQATRRPAQLPSATLDASGMPFVPVLSRGWSSFDGCSRTKTDSNTGRSLHRAQ